MNARGLLVREHHRQPSSLVGLAKLQLPQLAPQKLSIEELIFPGRAWALALFEANSALQLCIKNPFPPYSGRQTPGRGRSAPSSSTASRYPPTSYSHASTACCVAGSTTTAPGVVSKATFVRIDTLVYRALWWWMQRRHKNHQKRWLYGHYAQPQRTPNDSYRRVLGVFEGLEPSARKPACTVLRGLGAGDGFWPLGKAPYVRCC